MRVTVRLFAMLRERAGTGRREVDLPDGATAGDVWAALDLGPEPEGLALAVNRAYADRAAALHDGDEVALIPPVSGGAGVEPWVELTDGPLDLGALVRRVEHSGAGAIATFTGTVRERSRGQEVVRLEYEAYPEMVLEELRRIAVDVATRYELLGIAVAHRHGTLAIGDASVIIATSAEHRAPALTACQETIDTLKQRAPIWKKEHYEGGAVWIGQGILSRMATSPTPFDDRPRGPYDPYEPPADEPPPPPGASWETRLKRALGPLGVLIFAALSWGAKLKLVLLAAVKLKYFGTAATSIVSIGAYALLWGWRFAVLFVALLFIHELGHVVALRREGIPASAPMFIPFLGAAVFMKGLPRDAWVEAKIGLAGPVFGLASSAATLALAEALDSDLLRAAAYTGFFLNLFNLLPITPLDGGRAAAALHPYVWLGGAAGMAALFLVFPSPLLIIIALIGGLDGWRRLQAFRRGERLDYYDVSPRHRLAVAVTFAFLAASLVVGMQLSHIEV